MNGVVLVCLKTDPPELPQVGITRQDVQWISIPVPYTVVNLFFNSNSKTLNN